MATVKETVESGIAPIVLEFSEVSFFESSAKLVRSFLTVNSLDLGVLGYGQYRFVARRTKVGNHLVRRHLEKLFRIIPDCIAARPEIECWTVPVYARLLADSELAQVLVDLISLYPEVTPSKICIELSADILYEDLTLAAEKIEEIRALGFKVAVCEVGDQFCPVFRLAELKLDYAFMDSYSTDSLATEAEERIAGSLVRYLHYLSVKVIAPGLTDESKIAGAKRIGADGYTVDALLGVDAMEGGVSDE